MPDILHIFSNLPVLIKAVGLVGIFLIIFAESGLLIGFFLPGDSLLFTAGFLASTGIAGLDIRILLPVTFAAAVLGDNVGYVFGRRVGPKIFTKEQSLLFKKEYVGKAKEFYEKYGAMTVILARFTPIIRTFAPIMAGVADMNYRVFFFYNVVGGALWVSALLLSGYFLGKVIPNIDHYILPGVVVIIIVSLLPSIWHVVKSQRNKKRSK
jgi:membrane-associated protein